MVFVDSDLLIKCLQPKSNSINTQARKILSNLFKNNSVVKITIYNFAELYRGAYLSKKVATNLGIIDKFLKQFKLIFPTLESIKEYSRISANLNLKGQRIGDLDELIASIVICDSDILYTRNIRHFERIPLLELENWESGNRKNK